MSAFLFAACTQPVLVATNPAHTGAEEAINGEPVVSYAGEPVVMPLVMAGAPAESPLALPQAEDIPQDVPHGLPEQTIPPIQDAPADDAGSTAGGSAPVDAAEDAPEEEAAQPDAALDELLDAPITENTTAENATAENVQGGLAGAAHAPAEVTTTNTLTVAAALTELLAQSTAPGAKADIQPLPVLPVLPSSAPVQAPPIAPTPDGTERIVRVPILMYHYLSTPPPNADIYRKDLSVAPDLFAEHLDAMLAEGFTPITLYTLTQALMQGAPLPDNPVIITFDDAYRDNYENAFPRLRDRGMTATFFVVTDFLDEEREGYMTWDMAREMLAGGMSIESHGRNHVSLKGPDDDYLIWQALGSMETLAFELGVRPRYIAYPAGEYDEDTIRIFASAGYWGGVTTRQGAQQNNAEPFEMVRVRVRGTTSANDLIRLLRTDW